MSHGGIKRHYFKILRRRADAARSQGRWAVAASGYRRWLEYRSDDGPIWVQLGHMLREAGDVVGADESYRQAAALMPDDADLMFFRGYLEWRCGNTEAAASLYRQSYARDGNTQAAKAIEDLEANMAAQSPEPELSWMIDRVADASADIEVTIAESYDDPAEAQDRPDVTSPIETPRVVGIVDHIDHDIVHGWLMPADDNDAVIFTVDGNLVGRAWPDRNRPRGEGSEIRTSLAIDHAVAVHAHRQSDGTELIGSPFVTQPPAALEGASRRAADARVAIVKPLTLPPSAEVALFVTHSATGAIKPHIAGYITALKTQNIMVLLIPVVDRPLDIAPALLDMCAGVMIRENLGYDFGAWSHAITLYPEVYGAPILYLLNDSVIGPAAGGKFDRLIDRVRTSSADVVGLTESHEYRWHLQSYFIAFKAKALSTFPLQRFFDNVEIATDKDDVIRKFELPLAREVENAGCQIEVLYPSHSALNPVLYAWRNLLEDGYPFIKVLLLRGAFPDIDTNGWRDAMAAAQFDLALVDKVLYASEESVLREEDSRLYAHPIDFAVPSSSLKVSFYGPWNYDNGLGAASRGIIGALRRVGYRLNLHPIKKPFHVHRQVVPGVDIHDFRGDADIAIVHLNPDSWHLLTDSQRGEIHSARRRIGYWVWEMAHIPNAWWQDFGSVDRIWAPSRYCAKLFEAQDGAPVDVIPHTVPVPASPPPTAVERIALLRSLALPPEGRFVLFVFDGSSYLVRKNPAALVRGFTASGLAERGWTLVLKTKHVMDRAADGAALKNLVAQEKNVLLLERNLSSTDLERLVACADIYASPHASEGFGLTIAEAMAAARPVVATDFGGSTDFLDAGTGYPVRAHSWQLQDDFGHYTRGGEWARVDEPSLSFALAQAALAVERGDSEIGAAARERVRNYLSIESVSKAIAQSVSDMMADSVHRDAPRLAPLILGAGVPLDRGTGTRRVQIIPLTADGGAETDGLDDHTDAEWLAFAPRGSLLSPVFAFTLLKQADNRPDVALFYGDDVAGVVEHSIDQFRLKPDFDQTLLSAQDYVGAPLAIRTEVLESLGGLNPARGTAVVADLLFRAHHAGYSIARIPDVLLAHPGERVMATAADYSAMLSEQPFLEDFTVSTGLTPGTFSIGRRLTHGTEPTVTLIIPTCRSVNKGQDRSNIERLLDSLEKTDWPMCQLKVIVGDDIVGDADWAAATHPYALRRIETPRIMGEPFNYAAKMNLLWREAKTEQIVFLNDDVQPLSSGWLRALQTFALDAGVGGVGARLLYPDGSLQHAGLVAHSHSAAHAWIYRRQRRGTFHDWALVHREWSMVTGAVFATRRSLMDEVNGFDEVFSLEFNDIDLCLRLRGLGYRIVYTPYAEMIHVEKASRGETLPSGETIARFLSRWSEWLDRDPSGHPMLRRDRLDIRPNITHRQWYF